MARFDFIDAASKGYQYVWHERRAIVTLGLMPLMVKIGSYAAVSLFGLESNFLRQGLVLMPAYFLEGVVVMLVIRMALFGEHYAHLFAGPVERVLLPERLKRAILAGVIMYLLSKLASSFLAGGLMLNEEIASLDIVPETHGSAGNFVMSLMLMVFMIWAFRFFWLYVPAAMEISLPEFLKRIKGFMASIYMIGLWILCFIPMAAIMLGCARVLGILIPAQGASPIYIVLISLLQAVIELFVALSSGVAMGFAIRSIMTSESKPPRFF